MKDFSGRTAFITGGASGIGLATAKQLARRGMNLVIADIEDKALAGAEAEIAAFGGAVMPLRCDVRHAADVDAAAQSALERFGGVHVVFNNAGVVATGRVEDITAEAWQWVLDVNLWGVINSCRVFAPILKSQGEPSHIVNTASMAGLSSGPLMAPYFVSKFGVVALSEAMWYEAQIDGAAMGVSVLCPGFVRTRIHEAGRNRPEDVMSVTSGDAGATFLQLLSAGVDAGKSPDDVAEIIVDAIEHDRFWILPHGAESHASVRTRADAIVEGTSPVPIDWARWTPPGADEATDRVAGAG
jgi:NAD(P)-dependent dehydrogenase (short-subunit alcohol dehydrogenase family)